MNREGILIDLSHASEGTFWDVIKRSKQPVFCSHSGARALCDNDRNITDEQLRALAKNGGVIQTVAYGGFLRKDGKATIDDFVRQGKMLSCRLLSARLLQPRFAQCRTLPNTSRPA